MDRFWKFLRAVKGSIAAFHKKKRLMLRTYLTVLALVIFSALMYELWFSGPPEVPTTDISYTDFMAKVRHDEVVEARPNNQELFIAKLKDGTYVRTRVVSGLANPVPELEKRGVKIDFSETPTSPDIVAKRGYLTLGIFGTVVFWIFFFAWGIGPKGKFRFKWWGLSTKQADAEDKVTFDDVAGID